LEGSSKVKFYIHNEISENGEFLIEAGDANEAIQLFWLSMLQDIVEMTPRQQRYISKGTFEHSYYVHQGCFEAGDWHSSHEAYVRLASSDAVLVHAVFEKAYGDAQNEKYFGQVLQIIESWENE